MTFLLLFSYLLNCIKIEAHTKRTELEYQGNALAAKAVATVSVKIVAHMDEVHSTSAFTREASDRAIEPGLPFWIISCQHG